MAIDPKLPILVYFQLKTLLLEEILDGRALALGAWTTVGTAQR